MNKALATYEAMVLEIRMNKARAAIDCDHLEVRTTNAYWCRPPEFKGWRLFEVITYWRCIRCGTNFGGFAGIVKVEE